jgi:hypothetical protein
MNYSKCFVENVLLNIFYSKWFIQNDLFKMFYSKWFIQNVLLKMFYSKWFIQNEMLYSKWNVLFKMKCFIQNEMFYSKCFIQNVLFKMFYSKCFIQNVLINYSNLRPLKLNFFKRATKLTKSPRWFEIYLNQLRDLFKFCGLLRKLLL